ncbi:hypothetical protein [Wenjunlia vitaminophila]|nr:hypothetical protein [Wenjunlia vitaminophila]
MASVTHRYSGRMFLAVNTQQWFGFVYINVDAPARSFNRWSVGHTTFSDRFSYLDIVEELALWDANGSPHTGWNLLIRARNGNADFVVSAVNVDQ